MKIKKIPMRTCCVTREKYEKRELLRIVKTPEGIVIVDLSGKANGRGAYIKKDMVVLEKAMKNKALEKALLVAVPQEVYEEIKCIISK